MELDLHFQKANRKMGIFLKFWRKIFLWNLIVYASYSFRALLQLRLVTILHV